MIQTGVDGDDRIVATGSDLIGTFQLLRMGRGIHLRLGLALGLIVSSSAAVMASARILGRMVDGLAKGEQELGILAVGFLALESLAVLAQYVGRVMLADATIVITCGLRLQLFDKMGRLPMSYFDVQPLGRTVTRLTADVEGVEGFFSGTLARVLTALIDILAVLVVMLVTDLAFGGIVVAVCLPALAFSVALRRPIIHWLRTYKRHSAHLNAKLAEYLSGLQVIRIFGLEAWSQRLYDEAAAELLKAGIATLNWNSLVRPMAVFLCSLPTLIILWLGGERVLSGTMGFGLLVAYVRFGERFVSPIRVISTEIQNIQEAVVSAERVRRMLLEGEEEADLGQDGSLRPTLGGAVEFREVWMGYRGGEPVLRGVSFCVKAGMSVGLVGATGSGKTTTVNLLPRLYPFERGDILLDGTPIGDIERAHLRSQLGYVAQDVVVFKGTVRANLLAAVPTPVSDAAILAAASKTGLGTVLKRLPGGLDYELVEGGDNMSMGERQLLAFTRMMLRNPAILILDEATASIDEEAERLVQAATLELMRGRTAFVIAHRLGTIIHCDLILVFREGRVVEQGTHQSLMAEGGYYARLAKEQLTAQGAGPPV